MKDETEIIAVGVCGFIIIIFLAFLGHWVFDKETPNVTNVKLTPTEPKPIPFKIPDYQAGNSWHVSIPTSVPGACCHMIDVEGTKCVVCGCNMDAAITCRW